MRQRASGNRALVISRLLPGELPAFAAGRSPPDFTSPVA